MTRLHWLRGLWRGAMRGSQEAHVNPDLLRLTSEVPPDTDRAICIYPTGARGEWACKWMGISAEQAASTLYQMADFVVDHKIPPRKAWPR